MPKHVLINQSIWANWLISCVHHRNKMDECKEQVQIPPFNNISINQWNRCPFVTDHSVLPVITMKLIAINYRITTVTSKKALRYQARWKMSPPILQVIVINYASQPSTCQCRSCCAVKTLRYLFVTCVKSVIYAAVLCNRVGGRRSEKRGKYQRELFAANGDSAVGVNEMFQLITFIHWRMSPSWRILEDLVSLSCWLDCLIQVASEHVANDG